MCRPGTLLRGAQDAPEKRPQGPPCARGTPGSNPQRQRRGEEGMAQPHHVRPESRTPGAVEQRVQLTERPGRAQAPASTEDTALPASSPENQDGIQLDHRCLFSWPCPSGASALPRSKAATSTLGRASAAAALRPAVSPHWAAECGALPLGKRRLLRARSSISTTGHPLLALLRGHLVCAQHGSRPRGSSQQPCTQSLPCPAGGLSCSRAQGHLGSERGHRVQRDGQPTGATCCLVDTREDLCAQQG